LDKDKVADADWVEWLPAGYADETRLGVGNTLHQREEGARQGMSQTKKKRTTAVS